MTVRSVFFSVIDAFTPSAAGVNPRVAARAFSASKSLPASANSAFAFSTGIHPSTAARVMLPSGRAMSNCSAVFTWMTEKA